jgi:hypothetical protein
LSSFGTETDTSATIPTESSRAKANMFGSIAPLTQVPSAKGSGRGREGGSRTLRIMSFIWASLCVIKSKGQENIFGTTDACTREASSTT